MHISITGRHLEVTPALRAYVESRVARLQRSVDALELQVTLSAEKSRQRAEMQMRDPSGSFFAAEETHDMRSSIDQVVERLEAQARKHRNKMSDTHHGRRATAAKQDFLSADHDEVEDQPSSKKSRFIEY